MIYENCKTKRDAMFILKGKTDMLDTLTAMMVSGMSFKEAAKIALKELKQETILLENYFNNECGTYMDEV